MLSPLRLRATAPRWLHATANRAVQGSARLPRGQMGGMLATRTVFAPRVIIPLARGLATHAWNVPKTMKAAVIRDTGSALEIVEDQPVPQPAELKPGECLVKLDCTGVCHTDLHCAKGDWPISAKHPLIGGHEVRPPARRATSTLKAFCRVWELWSRSVRTRSLRQSSLEIVWVSSGWRTHVVTVSSAGRGSSKVRHKQSLRAVRSWRCDSSMSTCSVQWLHRRWYILSIRTLLRPARHPHSRELGQCRSRVHFMRSACAVSPSALVAC